MKRTVLSSCRSVALRQNFNFSAGIAFETDKKFESASNASSAGSKPEGWDNALPYESIPGPQPLPLIGNTWRYMPYIGEFHKIDLLDLHKILREKYGKVVALKGIPTMEDLVVIFAPEDIETLHRNDGAFPIRNIFKSFAYYRTKIRADVYQGINGLVSSHGQDWHNLRSKINPILMQPKTMLRYVESMDIIANEVLQHIHQLASRNAKGEMPDDFLNHLRRWTLETVAFVVLNRRIGCLDPNAKQDTESQILIKNLLRIFHLFYKIEFPPMMWKIYPTKTWKEYVRLLDSVTFTFVNYIKEAQQNRNNHVKASELGILHQLLEVDRKAALSLTMDLLVAGVDTTGTVAGSALYYIARHPHVQDKLHQEMRFLLPSKDTPVTAEILENASYLKAVIKEVHRVASTTIGIFRLTTKDMVFQGYQIPKGTTVCTTNLFLCRSEEYFASAKEFIPERWLRTDKGELLQKSAHPFVYLPFGFGPRACIGLRLASLELEVMLSKIIRNFRLEWNYKGMAFKATPFYCAAEPLKLGFKSREE